MRYILIRGWMITNFVKSNGLEFASDAEHGLADADDKTSMNDELSQLRTPLVAVSSMPYQKLRQMAKLLDGKVRSKTCLTTFFPNNPYTDVCGLDHGHIVPSISNATDTFPGMCTNEVSNLGFLGRRASTCNHCRKKHSKRNKCIPEMC